MIENPNRCDVQEASQEMSNHSLLEGQLRERGLVCVARGEIE